VAIRQFISLPKPQFPATIPLELNKIMDHGNVIIRFEKVSFGYDKDNLLLKEADFSVRENAKITLMYCHRHTGHATGMFGSNCE